MIAATGMLASTSQPDGRRAAVADTGSYITIVILGFLITLVVGQILMRAGHGFLREVFDSDETATSTTRLLGVLFHLVALGFLALVSTYDPIPVEGTVQRIVTRLGSVLLVLGILHGATLLILGRIRTRRRSQSIEESMSSQYEQSRRQRQGQRTQVIEAGGSTNGGGTSSGSSGPR